MGSSINPPGSPRVQWVSGKGGDRELKLRGGRAGRGWVSLAAWSGTWASCWGEGPPPEEGVWADVSRGADSGGRR